MSRTARAAFESRNRDLVPRSRSVEYAMDIRAELIELRDTLAHAHEDLLERRDPRRHLFAADERLVRLAERTREWAANSEGVEYVSPGQVRLPLPDDCMPAADGGAA